MRKGQKHSEETKKKMRGRPSWKKGTKLSEETKRKISQNRKGKGLGYTPFLGKTHLGETKKLIGEKGRGRIPWNKGLLGYKAGEEHYAWVGDKVKGCGSFGTRES